MRAIVKILNSLETLQTKIGIYDNFKRKYLVPCSISAIATVVMTLIFVFCFKVDVNRFISLFLVFVTVLVVSLWIFVPLRLENIRKTVDDLLSLHEDLLLRNFTQMMEIYVSCFKGMLMTSVELVDAQLAVGESTSDNHDKSVTDAVYWASDWDERMGKLCEGQSQLLPGFSIMVSEVCQNFYSYIAYPRKKFCTLEAAMNAHRSACEELKIAESYFLGSLKVPAIFKVVVTSLFLSSYF